MNARADITGVSCCAGVNATARQASSTKMACVVIPVRSDNASNRVGMAYD